MVPFRHGDIFGDVGDSIFMTSCFVVYEIYLHNADIAL